MCERQGWLRRAMSGALVLLAVCWHSVGLAARYPAQCEKGGHWPEHRVYKVIDGDTLKLADGRTVRVLGLNAPELPNRGRRGEPLASEARSALAQLVGNSVRLRLGQVKLDKHDRWLAHIYNEKGLNIAAVMLMNGYGFQVVQAPEDYGASCYQASESLAKKAKKGVWREAAYRPVPIAEASALRSGFQRIQGSIEKISIARSSVWIDLKGDTTLYIPPEAKAFFAGALSTSLLDDAVVAQGWVVDRYANKRRKKNIPKRWMMILTHPNMVKFSKR